MQSSSPTGADALAGPCTLQGVAYNLLREVGSPTNPANDAEYTLGRQATEAFDKLSVECEGDSSLMSEKELRDLYHDPAMRLSRELVEKTDLKGLPLCDSHGHRVGVITRSWVDNNELRVEARVDDPETAKKVRDGTYGALSLGVESLRDGPGMSRILKRNFKEVSVCAQPFFPGCKITMCAHKPRRSRTLRELNDRWKRKTPKPSDARAGAKTGAKAKTGAEAKTGANGGETKSSDYKSLPFLIRTFRGGSSSIDESNENESTDRNMTDQAPPQQTAAAVPPAQPQQPQQAQQSPAAAKRQQRDSAVKNEALRRKVKVLEANAAKSNERLADFEAREEAARVKYGEDQKENLTQFLKAMVASQGLESVDDLHDQVKDACQVLFTEPDSEHTAKAMWGLVKERNEHVAAAETFESQLSELQAKHDELVNDRDAGNRAPASSYDDVFEAGADEDEDEEKEEGDAEFDFGGSDRDEDAYDADPEKDGNDAMDEEPAPTPARTSAPPRVRRSPFAGRSPASRITGRKRSRQQERAPRNPWRAGNAPGQAITMKAAKRARVISRKLPQTQTDARNSAQLRWLMQADVPSVHDKTASHLAGRLVENRDVY
jgi:hypothetical protein